jgi:endonuclease/exonuclease/phosphatase family metal-dependent hydrolase
MRVVTWNLWWRFGRWERRREAIAVVLEQLQPDVCALQEVWADDRDGLAGPLAARLGLHHVWSPSPRPERWRRRLDAAPSGLEVGNAILSRHPIGEHEALRLPAGAAPDEGRTALFARVDHPVGPVPVVTTQLNSDPTDSATRCEQVAALARFVARRSAGRAPIVTGDLNAEPESDEVRLLQGHQTAPVVPGFALLDAWRFAEPGDPGWTWDPRNPLARATFDLGARVDYVLVGLVGGRRSVHAVRVAGDEPVGGEWASDHAAVVVDLDAALLQPGRARGPLEHRPPPPEGPPRRA